MVLVVRLGHGGFHPAAVLFLLPFRVLLVEVLSSASERDLRKNNGLCTAPLSIDKQPYCGLGIPRTSGKQEGPTELPTICGLRSRVTTKKVSAKMR